MLLVQTVAAQLIGFYAAAFVTRLAASKILQFRVSRVGKARCPKFQV